MKIVIKRDGREVPYDKSHIKNAIVSAMEAVDEYHEELAIYLTNTIEKTFQDQEKVNVEDIQDAVEKQLIKSNLASVAKAYILHRKERAEVRKLKALIGVEDDLKLPLNSLLVLSRRYLLRDEFGKIKETPRELFIRVANAVGEIDSKYGMSEEDVNNTIKQFYDVMVNGEFLPNSPTLMNAGTDLGQLSACFVLPVGDSIDDIFEAIKQTARIHKSGGGTGFSFSRLRPMNDVVQSTGGVASGPISFMSVFDKATEVIKQGGKRRGANMGILRIDHPDILNFIGCKEQEGTLSNFNISVAVTNKFMKALQRDGTVKLVNPRSGTVVQELSTRVIWNLILLMAWKNGEPGVVFIDKVNEKNPVPHMTIESTNPCGEQPLAPFESCNLGSINLSKMVTNGEVDLEKLKQTVRVAVHFLDNVIDANKFPLKKIEKATLANRKIGLGVMGFADMLVKLGVPYDSHAALGVAEEIMGYITSVARNESAKLGRERGSFPNFEKSKLKDTFDAMRNATVTTIAPTGTIGVIANCSSGIEPLFSIAYTRNVSESLGTDLTVVNPQFEGAVIKEGLSLEDVLRAISGKTSIQDVEEIPDSIRKVFVTAHDIFPANHVRMQAAFQKYTDNAVSKTINLPEHATLFDVERAYLLAYQLGCKGITVYRDKSRRQQVLCPRCVDE